MQGSLRRPRRSRVVSAITATKTQLQVLLGLLAIVPAAAEDPSIRSLGRGSLGIEGWSMP